MTYVKVLVNLVGVRVLPTFVTRKKQDIMKTGITLEEALSRASDGLRFKIGRSVELLRRAERLARMYDPEDGFYLAFSGGKDSQALYHVAEIAGVPFASHFSPTTIDPPEVIKFIRRNYPETEFGRPEMSIYDMAVKKGMLPTRVIRWCCAEFKEKGGAGKVTLIGVRRAESVKRSKRDEITLGSRKFSGSMDEFNGWREEELARKKNFDQFSDHEEQMVSCISGKDKIIVSPLLEWTSRDVWEFLNDVMRVPHCELYDQGFHRLGCIGCPMARPQEKRIGFERWPHVKRNWIRAINQIIDSKQLVGGGQRASFENFTLGAFPNPAEAVFDWWTKDKSFEEWKDEYLHPKLFDE